MIPEDESFLSSLLIRSITPHHGKLESSCRDELTVYSIFTRLTEHKGTTGKEVENSSYSSVITIFISAFCQMPYPAQQSLFINLCHHKLTWIFR